MKNLLITALFVVFNVGASITTKVVHIEPTALNHEIFVTHKGRVFEVDPKNTETLSILDQAREKNLKVELEIETGEKFNLDKNIEKILSAVIVEAYTAPKEVSVNYTPMDNYSPSNVQSYERATEIFKSLNKKTKRWSQCFNRAHIWSKHMYDDYKVDSMKILIYYTKKYRKEVSKKWWFHIAPMINVQGEYYVMDREFTSKPVTNDEWEKIFTKKIKDKTYRCKKIDNIKEYYESNNSVNEFCNIQYTSMYYWEPNDMSRLDKEASAKTQWIDWEIKVASREAFKKWKKVFERRRL